MSSDSRRNIKLKLSYDGTDFVGWQVQAKGRSVQGEIEKALEILHGEKIPLTGSGRTDSGVHATAQVANFYPNTSSSIPGNRYREALNSKLPQDIRILHSEEVEESFHSRFDARIRSYRYYLAPLNVAPAHMRKYCYSSKTPLNVGKMNELASYLVGTKDFTSFAALRDPNKNKVRTLHTVHFAQEGPYVVLHITGTAFLWKMVRTIVGTVLQELEKGSDPSVMQDILDAKSREAAGPSAPAQGLFLHKVTYESETTIY